MEIFVKTTDHISAFLYVLKLFLTSFWVPWNLKHRVAACSYVVCTWLRCHCDI